MPPFEFLENIPISDYLRNYALLGLRQIIVTIVTCKPRVDVSSIIRTIQTRP